MYYALVAAHVVCAVLGFGAVALSGVYGGFARGAQNGRPGRVDGNEGEEVTRYFASRGWAEWLIVPVPFLGAAALAARPAKGDLGDVWVLGGIVIWVAATALLVGAVRPAEDLIRRGAGGGRAGRRLMWSSIGSNLLFVVALALMVTQPR